VSADPAEPVDLFVTCVVDALMPEVGVATVKVLRATGATVDVPRGQTCCGQPAWNAGFVDEAAAVASTTLDALDANPGRTVVVPAGSCATMIRVYWPTLFELVGQPDRAARARAVGARTRELTEHLVATAPSPAPITPVGRTAVACHHGCHMTRELHLEEPPLEVLRRAGLPVAPWDGERCCGFGGTFSVTLPEASVTMADQKLDSLPAGVDTIVGADPSCLLQLGSRAAARGLVVRTRHIAEVLADGLEVPR
jgi:L-lactate dehydrogenase complex protein LldE